MFLLFLLTCRATARSFRVLFRVKRSNGSTPLRFASFPLFLHLFCNSFAAHVLFYLILSISIFLPSSMAAAREQAFGPTEPSERGERKRGILKTMKTAGGLLKSLDRTPVQGTPNLSIEPRYRDPPGPPI